MIYPHWFKNFLEKQMLKIEEHELGRQVRFGDFLVFFGNKNATPTSLNTYFPHFEFRGIRQTHSDIVIESTDQTTEADAHFSSEALVALQIKTADCLPIFAFEPTNKKIIAIHAGWRGVESQITIKALLKMRSLGAVVENLRWIIGPHIQKSSFEVDENVWAKIMESIPSGSFHQLQDFYIELPYKKYLIDLCSIVRAQVFSENTPIEHIESLSIDTLTNLSWHSYRREKENSGRNISFIVRLR